MLVDSHCHLDDKAFDKDRAKVVKLFESIGGGAIISNGTNLKSNKKVLKIAKKYKIVKAALGLYPTDALKLASIEPVLNFIRENKSKIIAIGEVGIDFYHIKDEKEQARECEIFVEVIKLANELGLPLIVHSRKAESKVLELLKEARVPVVLHYYCGSASDVKIAIERGYYFTIPTSIIRSKTIRKLARRVPLDRLLTETDAPYLGPTGRNDSRTVKLVIDKIASLKDVSAKEVEDQVWKNYTTLFATR